MPGSPPTSTTTRTSQPRVRRHREEPEVLDMTASSAVEPTIPLTFLSARYYIYQ